MMDKARKELARRLLKGRTGDRPWIVITHKDTYEVAVENDLDGVPFEDMVAEVVYREHDAELIAEAPSLMQEMLDELDKKDAEIHLLRFKAKCAKCCYMFHTSAAKILGYECPCGGSMVEIDDD
jgi:hypothetical protein